MDGLLAGDMQVLAACVETALTCRANPSVARGEVGCWAAGGLLGCGLLLGWGRLAAERGERNWAAAQLEFFSVECIFFFCFLPRLTGCFTFCQS